MNVECRMLSVEVSSSTFSTSHSAFLWRTGAVAQLGEHLLCKQGVVGSIPISSTRRARVDQTIENALFTWTFLQVTAAEKSFAVRPAVSTTVCFGLGCAQRWSS